MTPKCHCTAPSSAPGDVSITGVSSTSIQISWTPPPPANRNGIITEYRISVVEVDTGTQQDHVSPTTSFIVQSLHPSYTYHFSVSAHTVETGPYSAIEILQIPEDSKYYYVHEYACMHTTFRYQSQLIMLLFFSPKWIPSVIHEEN